jgi:hypothetical protein
MWREPAFDAFDSCDHDIYRDRRRDRFHHESYRDGLTLKALTASFSSGILLAIGLGISRMTRRIKVIGFLDFFANWDPVSRSS